MKVDLKRKLDRAATLQLGEDDDSEDDEQDNQEPEETSEEIAFVDDAVANKNKPKPGKLHLSASARRSRLRRLMQPRINGTFKVSEAIIADFRAGGTKKQKFEKIFEMVGFCRDPLLSLAPLCGQRILERLILGVLPAGMRATPHGNGIE